MDAKEWPPEHAADPLREARALAFWRQHDVPEESRGLLRDLYRLLLEIGCLTAGVLSIVGGLVWVLWRLG